MQRIYVGRADGINFHRTEARQNDLPPHAPVIGRSTWRLSRQMLGCIPLEKVLHLRRCPDRFRNLQLSLFLLERVYPSVNPPAEYSRLFPGRRRGPDRETTDGHPPLAAVD